MRSDKVVALVTGAAGFIGSHLCEALLDDGDQVVAIDCFSGYYSRIRNEENLSLLHGRRGFSFIEADLNTTAIAPLLRSIDTVYHLAGQPGVRSSWGPPFVEYVRHNVIATQRLLEACRDHSLRKLVFSSSSSVYGEAESLPTPESDTPKPISPYGVTKLAAEHLCEAYRRSFRIPVVTLRLFAVFGPRQRPDMAFARLVRAAVSGEPFELHGDGHQTRDFTFVGDVVRAMRCRPLTLGWSREPRGGTRTPLRHAIEIVEELCGALCVLNRAHAAGDARDTAADISLAEAAFGYRPRTPLREGLAAMVAAERLATQARR